MVHKGGAVTAAVPPAPQSLSDLFDAADASQLLDLHSRLELAAWVHNGASVRHEERH